MDGKIFCCAKSYAKRSRYALEAAWVVDLMNRLPVKPAAFLFH
jgi:hypothetical protein